MKIPSYTRIVAEELPSEIRKWIGKVVDPINNFMLAMKNGLNKGLTINENMAGAIKTVTVKNNTVSFSYSSSRKPIAVLLGGWVDSTDSTWYPTTVAPCLNWSYGTDGITCTFYGLNSAHTYTVTLIIFED